MTSNLDLTNSSEFMVIPYLRHFHGESPNGIKVRVTLTFQQIHPPHTVEFAVKRKVAESIVNAAGYTLLIYHVGFFQYYNYAFFLG